MSLTESKLKDLSDKKFDALHAKHKADWTAITKNAFNVARDHICEGRTPRQDDVLKALLPMLEPNEVLRSTKKKTMHVSKSTEKRLRNF